MAAESGNVYRLGGLRWSP